MIDAVYLLLALVPGHISGLGMRLVLSSVVSVTFNRCYWWSSVVCTGGIPSGLHVGRDELLEEEVHKEE